MSEAILEKYKIIGNMINNQDFEEYELENIGEIFDAIIEHDHEISPQTIKWLVLGWWISYNLKRDAINPSIGSESVG